MSELFPTSIRIMTIGICNFSGRLRGLLASNLFALCLLLDVQPALVLGGLMLISAVISLFLEETFGEETEKEKYLEEKEN